MKIYIVGILVCLVVSMMELMVWHDESKAFYFLWLAILNAILLGVK